ncbi:MAG: metallophosphoesterase [Clostridia bacterium]
MKIVIILILIFCLFLYWQNKGVTVSDIKYNNNKVPKEFIGYKIVQISDFHNTKFGKNLFNKIKSCNADIMVITGDMIDRRDYRLDIAVDFIRKIDIPIYFVSGNHEAWTYKYEEIKQAFLNENVIILENEKINIVKNKAKLNLHGVRDPGFMTEGYEFETPKDEINQYLKTKVDKSEFNILLSHRPELMETYVDNEIDLVLTGHAHGGQIRLPFIGGLYAPSQGVLPKYDGGLYKENKTTMYLSRGIGKSKFPFRIFNRPEIVSITLY